MSTIMAEHLEELDQFKEKTKKEAEKLVRDTFPQTVLELNKLLESEDFKIDRIDRIHEEVNIPSPGGVKHNDLSGEHTTKKRKLEDVENDISGSKMTVLPTGPVCCNIRLLEMIDVVKPRIRTLVDNANTIKMWITYMIPRIEDGNNFGVSIQEDTLAEARQVESDAATYLDQISRYFITRGKIVSKIAKYPQIDDYRRTIVELDEKEFISLRLVICELRNHYASLHDIITKNLDKIKKPRSSNTHNMY